MLSKKLIDQYDSLYERLLVKEVVIKSFRGMESAIDEGEYLVDETT